VKLVVVALVLASASIASAQDVPETYEAASAARLIFESEPTSLGIARADGHGGWEQLGLSPCEIVLPPGTVEAQPDGVVARTGYVPFGRDTSE
jgi:hypothetical protein